jgi:hypothetical protein
VSISAYFYHVIFPVILYVNDLDVTQEGGEIESNSSDISCM